MARPRKNPYEPGKDPRYVGGGRAGEPLIRNGCKGCGLLNGHTASCPSAGKVDRRPNPWYPNAGPYK